MVSAGKGDLSTDEVAKLIYQAIYGVSGYEYSPTRPADWRSKDARRAAEFIVLHYLVEKK